MITQIRDRFTRVQEQLRAFQHGLREAFDSARQQHGQDRLAGIQQSLNAMQPDWEIPRPVADGVRAWAFSAALWRPFRKWCMRLSLAGWILVLVLISDIPSDESPPEPLSVEKVVKAASWLENKSAIIWDHPGIALHLLQSVTMRWIFIVLVVYWLFRGLPNAQVRRPLEPPRWTHPLQRVINSLAWAATLERRFRATAVLASAANRCGIAYRRQNNPWESSPAAMMERHLLSAEHFILTAWKRWPTLKERAVKHRRHALQEHAGLVAAALRKEALRLDGPECDEALKRLAEMLITIAERYSDGHLGALLPKNDLEGLTPVRHREGWQLTLMVSGIVAVTAGAAAAGLPDGAATVAGPALAGLVMWRVNKRHGGRETGDAFDLFRPR
ncbi:hypothetical protein [Streptomyces acidiscabies]|uniref:Uncharacterized protein n=1 Tax=Streptomyces acidiscabies TaxID=42234 RepID=A0AAP6BIZ6_9ACTN|nr:hypothetical protein [Streptomyces acidiscabies]MBP5938595.1 hypothetical protein [Streptomyces sp. LBUM 1476]MBZ3909691.1 hypothetical protein [Streptomyces acidiscabies]MDX2965347.1 hypothetical protein [Streptomyces acidiscabies]MDX3024584.1 hypothetical protein [Streptomyces acidiscabies]MDX3795181.1 hypothetical protein [Streptomyces acidiscabies]